MHVSPTLLIASIFAIASVLAMWAAVRVFHASEYPRLPRALAVGGYTFAITLALLDRLVAQFTVLNSTLLAVLCLSALLLQIGAGVSVHFAMLKVAWAPRSEPLALSDFPKAGWTAFVRFFLVAAAVSIFPAFLLPELFAITALCLGVCIVLIVLQAGNWAKRMIDLAVVRRWHQQGRIDAFSL